MCEESQSVVYYYADVEPNSAVIFPFNCKKLKISLDELRTLPQPRVSLAFKEKLEGLDAVKPVVGDLTVSASSTGMRLSGRVQTLLKLQCHRCLRPYFQSLTVELDERFIIHGFHDEHSSPRERELGRDDFVETLPPDGVLDIDDVVYQAVTLATPNSCLCGDDCPGPPAPEAASTAGGLGKDKEVVTKKSIDPRWKNLKSLLPNEESD